MMNSGLCRLAFIVCAISAREMIGVLAPVAVIRMSASTSVVFSASHGIALPPIDCASAVACAAVRLVMIRRPMPCDCMWMAVSLPISPAPMTSTVRPLRLPKIFRASSTAA